MKGPAFARTAATTLPIAFMPTAPAAAAAPGANAASGGNGGGPSSGDSPSDGSGPATDNTAAPAPASASDSSLKKILIGLGPGMLLMLGSVALAGSGSFLSSLRALAGG